MKLNELIPTIFYKFALLLGQGRTQSQSARLFLSYADALKACQNFGYEDAVLTDVVFQKTNYLIKQIDLAAQPLTGPAMQSLTALLMALYYASNNTLAVMDYGGACGAHYFLLRPFLPREIILHWAVVETEAMAARAKLLETVELRFYSSIADAKESLGQIDLMHTTGAVQYAPAPESSLEEMLNCAPNFLLFNRLALSEGEKIIAIQESLLSANGPGPLPEMYQDRLCQYPITYIPKTNIEEMISQKYCMKIKFEDTTAYLNEKPLSLNGGYLAKRCK